VAEAKATRGDGKGGASTCDLYVSASSEVCAHTHNCIEGFVELIDAAFRLKKTCPSWGNSGRAPKPSAL